jgi:hypothetical protein
MTDQQFIKKTYATFHFPAILLIIGMMFLTPHGADGAEDPQVEKTSPDFGPNVLVFDPSMKDIQSRLDGVYAKQEAAQFGDGRFAYLFKPGNYDLDVQVGFYTQVAGLGRLPDDVQINGAVRVKARWMRNNNATCNFWRSAENFAVTPTLDNNVNIWATSQAVSLRRAHIKGHINLWDGGWSSGGFLADSIVDGQLNSGSQQQWLSRNTQFGKWVGGSWNMVFVGCTNPPAGEWPEHPYTVIDKTPTVREKPYLFVDEAGKYFVMVPPLGTDRTDVSWKDGKQPGSAVAIDDFYIAHAGKDNATTLNAALASGKHLLLTPGIYHLKETIEVTRPDTIVFGLGYPTLVAESGQTLMTVADVPGVKICGVVLEAGETESPNLLQVGEPGASASFPENPICLWDLFCRAGGAIAGKASCFVTINSHHVIGDNFWLWRADHGEGAKWEINRNKNGLIVNGSDVTLYDDLERRARTGLLLPVRNAL